MLTPAHKGPAGTVALNQALQGPIDEDTALNAHGVWFGPDDKVMQMRNQYELSWTLADGPKDQPVRGKGVFNGEMGRVKAVDPEEDELTVLLTMDGKSKRPRVVVDLICFMLLPSTKVRAAIPV